MELSNIKPFVRFARLMSLNSNSVFSEVSPVDARLFYTHNGEGKIKVDDKIFTMRPLSLLYIAPGQKYRFLSCNVVCTAINFDFGDNFSYLETPIPPIITDTHNSNHILENTSFSDVVCFDKFYHIPEAGSLQTYFIKIRNAYEKKLPFYRLETSTLMAYILLKIAQTSKRDLSGQDKFDIEKITEYIHKHYNEEINNSSLAEIFFFHPNYLNSQFKKCIGKSLHSYVLEVRVLKSVELMESTSKSITEIAEECGFNSVNYFIRYFKKIIGISPVSYRKRLSV